MPLFASFAHKESVLCAKRCYLVYRKKTITALHLNYVLLFNINIKVCNTSSEKKYKTMRYVTRGDVSLDYVKYQLIRNIKLREISLVNIILNNII